MSTTSFNNSNKTADETKDDEPFQRLLQLAKLPIATTTAPLHSITMLNLTGCGLDSLPTGFETTFSNLSILFLSNNHFRVMPAVIGACPHLQMVAFKSNHMQSIHPDALQPQLRWLILTDNFLTEIPDTIGRCQKLQKCMLSGNQIQELPAAIQQCTRLELIRLASNQLQHVPLELLKLPRLAWVALSDNPFLTQLIGSCDDESSVVEPLPVIAGLTHELLLSSSAQVLGQGAGGITRKVIHPTTRVPVAVKTQPTDQVMTSDGLASHERAIAQAASALKCPGLIQVLGQTEPTTDGSSSLVMEFLDNYHALAGPPSFETCCRDVYSGDSPITTRRQAQIVVSTLLQALTALHHSGICHGDVYGHNILVNAENPEQVRLSDFGAAFFYKKQAKHSISATKTTSGGGGNDENDSVLFVSLLQRIELRAFAILVDEVNALVGKSGDTDNAASTNLANRCRAHDSTFDSIYIWWKQQQLVGMAKEFGVGIDEWAVVEEKQP